MAYYYEVVRRNRRHTVRVLIVSPDNLATEKLNDFITLHWDDLPDMPKMIGRIDYSIRTITHIKKIPDNYFDSTMYIDSDSIMIMQSATR